jgi:hypothetical protein
LGPLTAGGLSDALQPWAQEESLRYALLILGPGYFLSGWYAWRASKTVTHDLKDAELRSDREHPATFDANGEVTWPRR